MRILFATDFHGSTATWRKAVSAGRDLRVDVLILSGDLTAKALVPITDVGNGSYSLDFFGEHAVVRDRDELAALERSLENAGRYTARLPEACERELPGDDRVRQRLFADCARRRLSQWMMHLGDALGQCRHMHAVVMPGNDDEPGIDDVLRSFTRRARLHYALGEAVCCDDVTVVSLAHVNSTPWRTPREADEPRMARLCEEVAALAGDATPVVFNFHAPPHGTRLDLAPRIQSDGKVARDAHGVVLTHVGSRAVRDAIMRFRPVLSLHGHVHESPAVEHLGSTVAGNPGSEYEQGVLRALLFEVDRNGVKEWRRIER